MAKEILTTENIREDLQKLVKCKENIASEWRFAYIIPITMFAFMVGFFLHNVWIGILIFLFAVYHIIYYVIETRRSIKLKKILKNEINHDAFSISVEELSRIASETIYEPHRGIRSTHVAREVKTLYFQGGRSWRIHNFGKHYEWSKQYNMSSSGLANTSVKGNTFYFVSLKYDDEIAYVYNTKFFDLQK